MLTTAQKIFIAKIAYWFLMAGRKTIGRTNETQVWRGGVRWALDLREGIDFSIYLLGSFEPRTQKLYRRLVKPGDTIFDIGANIGSHTLPLARLVGSQGRVFAFEPPNFPDPNLLENMDLNTGLRSSIIAPQIVVTAPPKTTAPPTSF